MSQRILIALAVVLAAVTGTGRLKPPAPSPTGTATTSFAQAAYGALPMRFEQNQGQSDAGVDFLARGSGYAVLLTPTEAVLKVRRSADREPAQSEDVLRLQMTGSNEHPVATPEDRLPGDSNYLVGKDANGWHTGIPNYSKVRYENIYPGIDLVYYGNQRQLEYDFVVSPGANPSDIRLTLDGAARAEVAANGDLVARVSDHDVRFNRPVIYQDRLDGSGRDIVEGRYVFTGAQQVAFDIGAYDASRPLVIDPVLSYSTYLGGSLNEGAHAIAVDSGGNAYITGYTASSNFPVKAGGFQTVNKGGPTSTPPAFTGPGGDVFVAKLNNSGSALLYSTYIGGTDNDAAYGIAVDGSGNAYVTGSTDSIDFPTVSAFQPQYGNFPLGANGDSFVAKLNPGGTALVYSTYLSGQSLSKARAIAVDSGGNAYVAGGAFINFPTTTPGGLQPTQSSGEDVFVAKVAPAGSTLLYSRLIGGSGLEEALGIAIDTAGNAYITGITGSNNYPISGAFQGVNNGGQGDAFVTKLNTTGATILFSTYLGGDGQDVGRAITVDSVGNMYVAGGAAATTTTVFPTLPGNVVRRTNVLGEAFVAKFLTNGGFSYSTFIGGNNNGEEAYGVAVDSSFNAYVTGMTCSNDFPVVAALQPTYGGFNGLLCDAFVSKLNTNATALTFSTYLGGTGGDRGTAIALDSAGSIYVAGITTSATGFPTAVTTSPAGLPTPSVIQGTNAGGEDVFVTKIANVAPPTVTGITPAVGPTAGGTAVTVTGTGFTTGLILTIGGLPATKVTVVNPTTITAVTPAHVAGVVDVIANNLDLQSGVKTGAFAFGPALLIDRTSLLFNGTKSGNTISQVTAPQDVTVTQSEGAPANWTATANQPWVQITAGTGFGPGRFKVGIVNIAGLPTTGSVTATVTIASSLPVSSTVGVTLTLAASGTTTAAFGSFDTPDNGATNVTGAIPVTGWALDDLGVVRVQLWRNCVEAIDRGLGACASATPTTPPDYVYIGDVAFLPGARPDVEAAVGPTVPQAYKAGWGYLMSTNALPHVPAPASPQGGQGTFTLYAYAIDLETNFTLLGTKTITLNNDNATIPFGSIDTPAQGGTMTVSPYASFGWAMTQNPKCIITSSPTAYRVYIDGVQRTLTPNVNWFPGLTRPDIAAAQPGRCNTNDALAAYYIDAAALGLQNGLHTTGWDVIDNGNNVTGIGSRFFDILVGSSVTAADVSGDVVSGFSRTITSDRPAVLGHSSDLALLSPGVRSVQVQVGNAPTTAMEPNSEGTYAVQFPAGGRVAFDFDGPVDAGYQIVGGELRALPGGSTFDAGAGTFAWQPAVPFLGPFQLVFLSGSSRIDVRATIIDPTKSASLSMHIDTPGDGTAAARSFVVAGWALDQLATTGSGIDTLHVWAYRRDAVALPQFLGAAAVGGARLDVAGAYGDQFDRSGFSLTTPQLAPGVYDLLVYPWSHRTGRFEAAESVRIVVQ